MKPAMPKYFLVAALFLAAPAHAGGPMSLCTVGTGDPVKYSGAGTVTLNHDQGTLGSRTKEQADALVTEAVSLWTNVGTATVTLARGSDLPVDVTAANYTTYLSVFNDGLNPVIYDTDGSIIDDHIGVGAKNSILGFAGSSYSWNATICWFTEGRAVINGYLAIDDTMMKTVLAHEVGHLIGLDHTQLDNTQGLQSADLSNYPLMYPIAYRDYVSLHEDDMASVSTLYPDATLSSVYGELTGTFTEAGGTPIRGANLWAEETTSHQLFSIVSDYLKDNTGYFRLLLPAGTYTLHAEAVQTGFNGGSSVGPYSEVYPGDPSFQPPLYVGGVAMTPVTLGNGTPTQIVINAGCAATATFRLDGTGSVGGNCISTPSAPVMGTATAGIGQLSVSFTPGALNGGTLVNHIVNCNPWASGSGASSPITVSGLTAGTPYTCWVRTQTNQGYSPWSAASNAATPTGGLPSAPVMGTATAGAGQLGVAFTPGALNGGTLVNHIVNCTPGGVGSAMSSPITVSGLTAGTSYRCWVRTQTNLGYSPWSAASNAVTPTAVVGPPSAPVMGTATAGAGQLSVSFTPGALNGGTPGNHIVNCTPGGVGTATSSPVTVSGLTAGISYRCWVRTLNELGYSPWSAASNSVIPTAGLPAAPVMGTATAGAGQLSVAFTPGNLNGGTLVNHIVNCTPWASGSGASSPITVSGLTAGTPYTCWVRTQTNLGYSSWSGASNAATPTAVVGPPSAPTMGTATAGAGQLSVAFTSGALNGGTLVNHIVNCTPWASGSGASSPITIGGLTAGTPYTCWVRTQTTLGYSPWSAASNAATPTAVVGPPSAPTMGTATAGAGQLSVAFTSGALNGGTLVNHIVNCTPWASGSGASSPITVGGLTAGTPYTCWVRTQTTLGYSPWSGASNAATPTP